MKPKISIGFLFLAALLFAQSNCLEAEKPDYEKLRADLATRNGQKSYLLLLERFLLNDSLLNKKENHELYYGYVFQKGFSKRTSKKQAERVKKALNHETLYRVGFEKRKKQLRSLMQKTPLSVPLHKALCTIINEEGLFDLRDKCQLRFIGIIDAIMRSGSGLEKDCPFYIINQENIFDVLAVLDLEAVGAFEEEQGLYKVNVAQNEMQVASLYFSLYKS